MSWKYFTTDFLKMTLSTRKKAYEFDIEMMGNSRNTSYEKIKTSETLLESTF